ncbi:MAG: hypothetical protein BWY35_01046 [Firmicutes bacterium ADurb.Bin248]|nr:MAG: hypothetical protein BWY35_01046 [Firmicutes bacterium ADurb.Bin248]
MRTPLSVILTVPDEAAAILFVVGIVAPAFMDTV